MFHKAWCVHVTANCRVEGISHEATCSMQSGSYSQFASYVPSMGQTP